MKKLLSRVKKSNKGFTLIELIIVIAIIAVLAAVIAPQYIKYVEKSKASTDMNSAAVIEQAVGTLVADGKMVDGGYVTWTCTSAGTLALTPGTGGTATLSDLQAVVGDTVKTQSKKATDTATLYFIVDGTKVIVSTSTTKTDDVYTPYDYKTSWAS